jgi:hypothetical protein
LAEHTLGGVAVDFYLYFPDEDNAGTAAARLRESGYSVESRLGADNENWLVLASRELSDQDFEVAEESMEELASSLGGEYDGYEREA